MNIPQPPPGQGPIDPRGALTPPPPPSGGANAGADPSIAPGIAPWPQPAAAPQGAVNPQGQPGSQPSPMPGATIGWGPSPVAPPRRLRVGRLIVVTVILLLLAGSLLMNVLFAAGGLAGSDQQSTLVEGDAREQIAVVPITGEINDATEARVDRMLKRAQDDSAVKAVIILIDTPGGSVTASDEIYKRIRKFKSIKGVPVVVAMRGMATSGGYYAACAADYIVAERTTLTGNIGVLMPQYNFSKLLDKYGVEENTVVSTGATYKNTGSMFKPQTAADEAYLQDLIDSAFTQFKAVIKEGRKDKVKDLDKVANGKAYTAQQALDLHLIDEIDDGGYIDKAIDYASKQANLEKPTVVKYEEKISLLNLIMARFGAGDRAGGGVTINLDASAIDRLSSQRVMYKYNGPSFSASGQ